MSDQDEVWVREQYHFGEQVRNVDLFYDTMGHILGALLDEHPIPSSLPIMVLMGTMVRENEHPHEIYYRTLDFLEDEGLIRQAPAVPRSASIAEEAAESPMVFYSLTLKGMSILALKPKELFPEASPNQTVGDVLIAEAKKEASQARSEISKRVIGWALGQAGRWIVGG
jgi:hypothetical protein